MKNIIEELNASGVFIYVTDGKLKTKAEQGAITPEIANTIRGHKNELLAFLQNNIGSEGRVTILPRDPEVSLLKLSFAQQRLWFIDQMDKQASVAYHISFGLRLIGVLNRTALLAALDGIVQRHEILRTRFIGVAEQVQQKIEEKAKFTLQEQNLSQASEAEYQQVCRIATDTPFDFATGPLIRGELLTLSGPCHELLITMHHIISDGWSIGIFSKELSILYHAFCQQQADPLPALPIQYADYAQWQHQWLKGERLQQQKDYWLEKLKGAPELVTLPLDYARSEIQDYEGASIDVSLETELSYRLKAFSQQQSTTLYMTLLAAWAAVVGRLASQESVVIGTPNANRNSAELEGLIGFFINTQAMRVDLDDQLSVKQLLIQVKNTALAAQKYQDIQFEQVVETLNPERTMAHSPIFQLMFNWQNTPAQESNDTIEFGELHIEEVDADNHMAQYDLSLDLFEQEGDIVGRFNYATSLFTEQTIKRHWRYLTAMLIGMIENPTGLVNQINILPKEEQQQQLITFNSPAVTYSGANSIQARFEAQVDQCADKVAAVYNTDSHNEQISYSDLNRRANQLADYLTQQGIVANTLVGLYAQRSIDFLVGVLAILKAGGAYIPLDPTNPKERLAHMVADAKISVILSQIALENTLEFPSSCQCVFLDDTAQFSGYSVVNPVNKSQGDDLAYMIYTSGSTGMPKGALVHHNGALNHIDAEFDLLGLMVNDELQPTNLLQSAASSSDVSVWQFLAPVICGGKTVILDNMANLAKCVTLMQEEQVNLIQTAPVVLQMLLDYLEKQPENAAQLPHLSWLMTIAEASPVPLINRWFAKYPHIPVMNGFGPSEASDDITYHIMRETLSTEVLTVPIGKPIPNMTMYVLDKHQQLQPVGSVGELCVSGVGVGLGYWNNPARTAESFVDNPFKNENGIHGKCLYRTGDLGRWRQDGSLEFIGRLDNQIKIRGFRVELGEVEAILSKVEGVADVAVLVYQTDTKENRLVAYVVLKSLNTGLDGAKLRTALKDSLPEYMIPSSFTFLESMPLNAADKIDRKALPAPDLSKILTQYVAPVTENEKILAQIWQGLLTIERIGRTDNFFQLGGHSLLMITLLEKIKQKDLTIDIVSLFNAPTLEDMAENLCAISVQSVQIEIPKNLLASEFSDENDDIYEDVEELIL
ncbi:MAG: amino acid adenylation domain-containing protein [Paraglaciecola sp.]|jgi:amino acid adenylation domain-containing protein